MTGFSLDWLRLREPFDRVARDAGLTRRFAALLPPQPRLLDLGAGSGANLRFLAPHLGAEQSWLLVDDDPGLLAAAARAAPTGCAVETRRLDLARDMMRLDLAEADAVTAAAFLDLVSARWIAEFADRLAAAALPLLTVLSVDGRAVWQPVDPADAAIAASFSADQGRDKGFGPALGAAAAPVLARRLADAGYAVTLAASDWRIGPADAAFATALAAGMAAAAASADPGLARRAAGWRERRLAQAAVGALTLVLGHLDLLAIPRRRARSAENMARRGAAWY